MTTQDAVADAKRPMRLYLEDLLSALKHIFCRTSLLPHDVVFEPSSQTGNGNDPTAPADLQIQDDPTPLPKLETTTETRVAQPPASQKSDSVPVSYPFSKGHARQDSQETEGLLLKDLDLPSKWDLTKSVEVDMGFFYESSVFFLTWKGTLSTGDASGEKQEVALKWFAVWKRVLGTAESRKRLRQKFDTWLDLNHPNILPFLGVMRRKPGIPYPLCMINPWMENGGLLQYLKKNPEADKIAMLRDVGKGLAYLHAQDPPVLHGDLRAHNVLVNPAGDALLCDYDLIDLMEDHIGGSMSSVDWARWSAPECNDPSLGPHSGRAPPADIFSFGMLCYELLSGEPPFRKQIAPTAMMRVVWGERPEIRPEWKMDRVGSRICEIMEECWQQDPESRPSASLVVQKLSQTESAHR